MRDDEFSPDEILHLAKGLRVAPSAEFSKRVMERVSVEPRPIWTSIGRMAAVYAGVAASVLIWVLLFGRPGSLPTRPPPATAEAPFITPSGR